MPNIRVDEQVYRFLQKHAEPLVDTPNSVLRRLLALEPEAEESDDPSLAARRSRRQKTARSQRRRRTRRKRHRTRTGEILPEEEYAEAILRVLHEHGGEASAAGVLAAIGQQLSSRFTEADKRRLPSGGIRWQSRTHFARIKLVERGLMAKDVPRGIWRLTDQGKEEVAVA